MQRLELKPNHKPIKSYYQTLQKYQQLGIKHELGVKDAFAELLKTCCQKFSWQLIQEQSLKINNKLLRPDGVIIRHDTLKHGYWEAKDSKDDLEKEVKQKFNQGYPKDNIIFWSPQRLILYQNSKLTFDEGIDKPENLVLGVKLFFEYRKPEIANWDIAAIEFSNQVKDLATGLLNLIETQKKTNKHFISAFNDFTLLCRQAINPNLSERVVEEMLIQHLLTERIFRKLFDNPDFVRRNAIAAEIEKVITALTEKAFNRDKFLGNLDYFYQALENAAATVTDFSEKQSFLNRVYEKFFQGFSTEIADTHGIVYTPQEVVSFMVKSVELILQREFNKSLSDRTVAILDPFVGTGNFILSVMREIEKPA
jgi:type I restriction-modification system DNA methylase subunit